MIIIYFAVSPNPVEIIKPNSTVYMIPSIHLLRGARYVLSSLEKIYISSPRILKKNNNNTIQIHPSLFTIYTLTLYQSPPARKIIMYVLFAFTCLMPVHTAVLAFLSRISGGRIRHVLGQL